MNSGIFIFIVLFFSFANAELPIVQMTKQGHAFKRSNEFSVLGQAWQDPSGTVWSDIVRRYDGIPERMHFMEAKKFCEDLGGRLPNKADYLRFIGYMGAVGENLSRYTPQILPDLTEDTWLGDFEYYSYSGTYTVYYFTRYGSIDLGAKWDGGTDRYTVRCIK